MAVPADIFPPVCPAVSGIAIHYNEFLKDDLLIIGDRERKNLTLFLSGKGFYFAEYDDCLP